MQPAASTTDSGIYQATHKIRFVTAASLFDGHDASINIMRRILQSSGAEVIHLGHNRSVLEVVNAALQEDVQGIALSSYQGGHIEYFEYLRELLAGAGAGHIRIFGGGGGVIVGSEIERLHRSGITRIYSPEDGRVMGLQGIINDMLRQTDFDPAAAGHGNPASLGPTGDFVRIGRMLSAIENETTVAGVSPEANGGPATPPVLGITGPGGAGKSSLTDEIILRFLDANPDARAAVLAVDPTRRKTGGALLGDRIRMNSLAIHPERTYFRSMATRGSGRSVSDSVKAATGALRTAGFDLIIVETSGIGQADAEIVELADLTLYVMTAEFGAPTQLEKITMLDYADVVALNKAEKSGAQDAVAHVKKQYQRNHGFFDRDPADMPVYPTIAGRFHDPGVNVLFDALMDLLRARSGAGFAKTGTELPQASPAVPAATADQKTDIIPAARGRYLSEIATTLRDYRTEAETQADIARRRDALLLSRDILREAGEEDTGGVLATQIEQFDTRLGPELREFLDGWPALRETLRGEETVFRVRDREIRQPLKSETLSGLKLPVLALPAFTSARELTLYYYKENLPGRFPFTAGVFPFRKADELPARMFAGEGGPERTNIRFHYLSRGQTAARLSTAFDSVTLYGEDPHTRPDIFGKIGNSGVSIPSLDDCKRLYSGFDLTAPTTSVSMTINGPAPMLLAFFFNTAIDQQVERHLRETGGMESAREKIKAFYESKGLQVPVYRRDLPDGHDGGGVTLLGLAGDRLVDAETYGRIKADVLTRVRGTVQADILKEDQAQNTCIFSTPFALSMMGDMQAYFTEHAIRNFYSVSISGYHIAEAGANPITQLAFTLANGFTYLEYYRARGLDVDAFAPNFSFFFSNGIDAEYSVIGRVARRIWAVALRRLYGAGERSQKLKYHIQTSGRSLHAREIDFNDIRTTLQALYALYDNCNSLHTNAYDEAITTPTEASVRRALAIQLIINKELGLNQNHNPVQGAYIIDELTDLVEEAVLSEFDRLTERGGVPGAMETMYQRNKIQEESLHYEHLKHSGELPIVGINTFLNEGETEAPAVELIRSSDEEKHEQINRIAGLHQAFASDAPAALSRLKHAARSGGNVFAELMETAKVASLGQISSALYEVGGSYRRNM